MIILLTDCEKCTHKAVCSYKNNAKYDADYLASRKYDEENGSTNTDWDTMSKLRHVDIAFSCKDFNEIQGVNWR